MRYVLLLALSLAPLPAREAPDAAPAPAEQAAPAQAKPYMDLLAAHKAFLTALADALKDVTNAPTANAAAPKVAELQVQAKALIKQENDVLALGDPDKETREFLSSRPDKQEMGRLAQKSIGRALELLNANPACHGSQALERAIENVLNIYLGENVE